MSNAIVFIVTTLVNLYIITFILRIMFQLQRVDYRNPVVQFIATVTNPLVLPLRRIIPSAGKVDSASVVAAVGLKLAEVALLTILLCSVVPPIPQLVGITLISLVRMLLNFYFFVILASVILSWVSAGGYNPAAAVIAQLAEPVLGPFRKLIPPIGGFDITPIFAIIAIQALMMLLPVSVYAGLQCASAIQML